MSIKLIDEHYEDCFSKVKSTLNYIDKSNIAELLKEAENILSEFNFNMREQYIIPNETIYKELKSNYVEASLEVSFLGKITFGLFDSIDYKKRKNIKIECDKYESLFKEDSKHLSNILITMKEYINNKVSEYCLLELRKIPEYRDAEIELSIISNDPYYIDNIAKLKSLYSFTDKTLEVMRKIDMSYVSKKEGKDPVELFKLDKDIKSNINELNGLTNEIYRLGIEVSNDSNIRKNLYKIKQLNSADYLDQFNSLLKDLDLLFNQIENIRKKLSEDLEFLINELNTKEGTQEYIIDKYRHEFYSELGIYEE